MRTTLVWRAFCAAMILMLGLGLLAPGIAVAPAAASTTERSVEEDVGIAQMDPNVYNTLRVYGRDSEGAGNFVVDDPETDITPEDAPYTDLGSIFDPQGTQAPRKDFITWNPIWISEQHTPDENQALYQQIYVNGINGAEKVNFFPALMQEFTYQLTDLAYVPGASPGRLPLPAIGQAGSTQFVFPMAMRYGDLFDANGNVDNTSGNAQYGYGLTSLDANFDGMPDIVQVHSERSLASLMGLAAGTWLDFDGDEVFDYLDTDATPLSGDELVILALNPVRLDIGESVQFLDYLVTLEGVGDADATLAVRYVGDRVPDVPAHSHTIPVGGMRFIDRHGSTTPAPNGGDAVVATPVSPFFVHLTTVDTGGNAAAVRIGRGLGAPFSAMESAPNVPDLEPGDPWFLKRIYVDGHEYDVVAIGTQGQEGFQFITIRTPVPKEPVYIAQHSVELQGYYYEEWLSVMPPYNHEHFIFTDIQALTRFPDEESPPNTGTVPEEVEPTIDFVGRLVGPVAPILQRNGPYPYYGINPNVPYGDPREMFMFYVVEESNPQFLGELKELYAEVEDPQAATSPYREFWYDHQWWTQPWLFTDLVLPDISANRTGTSDPDLYLLTSSWMVDQSEFLQWVQDGTGDPPPPLRYNLDWATPPRETWIRDETVNDFATLWDERGGVPRAQFWFDPAVGGKKYKNENGVRLYGRLNEGPGLRTATDPEAPAYPVEVWPYSLQSGLHEPRQQLQRSAAWPVWADFHRGRRRAREGLHADVVRAAILR